MSWPPALTMDSVECEWRCRGAQVRGQAISGVAARAAPHSLLTHKHVLPVGPWLLLLLLVRVQALDRGRQPLPCRRHQHAASHGVQAHTQAVDGRLRGARVLAHRW